MKRFLLFAGDTYYPHGGWGDYKGDYDTIEECYRKLALAEVSYDWAHAYDTTKEISRNLI